MFILMDSHFSDYDTHDVIIEKYLGEDSKVVADICVEHIGNDVEEVNGEYVATDTPVPKIVFNGGSSAFRKIVTEEIVRHDIESTIVLPAWIMFGEPF